MLVVWYALCVVCGSSCDAYCVLLVVLCVLRCLSVVVCSALCAGSCVLFAFLYGCFSFLFLWVVCCLLFVGCGFPVDACLHFVVCVALCIVRWSLSVGRCSLLAVNC